MATLQQLLHTVDEVGVDVAFVRECHVLRLLVRALAQPHPRAQADHRAHVSGGAPQVRLEHHPDRIAELRVQDVLEERDRFGGIARLLHVDPHERAVLLRLPDDRAHVTKTSVLVDVEPHLRELDGDVGIGLNRVHALEELEIGAAGALRLLGVEHRLASPRRSREADRLLALRSWSVVMASSIVSPATKRDASVRASPFRRTKRKMRGCSLSHRKAARSISGKTWSRRGHAPATPHWG